MQPKSGPKCLNVVDVHAKTKTDLRHRDYPVYTRWLVVNGAIKKLFV